MNLDNPIFWQIVSMSAIWIAYFAIHSALASLTCKQLVEQFWQSSIRYYRIVYNFLAITLVFVPIMVLYLSPSKMLWEYREVGAIVTNMIAIIAMIGFYHSSRFYNMQEFIGIAQLQSKVGQPQVENPLRFSPYHRWVRHPWYFFGLLIVWTRDMNVLMLTSAIWISIYFIVGSRLEDNKLVIEYGNLYKEYIQKVSGIIPLPWKHLTSAQLREFPNKYL